MNPRIIAATAVRVARQMISTCSVRSSIRSFSEGYG